MIWQPRDGARPLMVHRPLPHHDLDKHRQDHRRRGEGRGPLVPWDVLARVRSGEPDRPGAQRRPQHPHHCEQGERRDPCRVLQPPWGASRRIFAPPKAGGSRGGLRLLGVPNLGIRTPPQLRQSSPGRTPLARPGPAPAPRAQRPSAPRPLPAAVLPAAGLPCTAVFSVAGRSPPELGPRR